MPSQESDALRALYASWAERLAANPEMDLPTLRDVFEEWHLVTAEPEGVTYAEVDADGVPSVWCIPQGAASDRVALFTHGGGFVVGSRHTHRKMAGHLAKAIGCRALVVDYRRAPESPFPAQLDDCVKVYRWLLASEGIAPNHIVTTGDSAGGNLAIAIPLKLRQDGDPLPAAILPMSPWLDMEGKGETLTTNAGTDALVQLPLLLAMAGMFLGEGSAIDPLANPLYADPAGLPPIYMNAGGAECLLSDSTRFADNAKRAGVDVTLEISDGMQHVYPFMAGRAKEADVAVANMAAFARKHLGL